MSTQLQIQTQKQVQLQFLDNGIHRLIIALERLEGYLAAESQQAKLEKWVAIGTKLDLHDDKTNPPSKESFYTELHIQVLNASKQGRFSGYMDGANKNSFEDETQLIDNSASYFLNDILEWYGGRTAQEPNDVERFAVPVIAAITDKKLVGADIDKLIFDYVGDLDDDLHTKSDDYKRAAIEEGISAIIKAQEELRKQMEELEKAGMEGKIGGDAQSMLIVI